MPTTYPVKWRDKEYVMSDLTVGMKRAYCDWLIKRLRQEAIEDMRGMPTILNSYLDGLKSRVWWVARRMGPAVAESLKSPEGNLHFNRLLFGESAKALTDDELQALVDDKEADQIAANDDLAATGFEPTEETPFPPANDYMLALDAVLEELAPKAPARPTSGSEPTGTK